VSDLVARVHAVHGDAWQAEGRMREPWGGAVGEVRGLRLMAAGLLGAPWNNGDAHDPDADIDAARAWYEARGVREWGVRVPDGMPWRHGRHLFRRDLMALVPDAFRPAPVVAGLELSAAAPEDLDELAALDATAYDDEVARSRAWIEPHLHAPQTTTVRARLGGEIAGTGWALVADGRAGPSVFIGGVAVAERARRRGVGAALSSWLVQIGFGAGAALAVLAPDTAEAARIYARLGFAAVTAFHVHAAPD
jgi:GNAT superfamily N-acetyltransferase